MDVTVLGTADVAARLGIGCERVRQLANSGRLPARRMPKGQRVFLAEDVERLAEERARNRTSETPIVPQEQDGIRVKPEKTKTPDVKQVSSLLSIRLGEQGAR